MNKPEMLYKIAKGLLETSTKYSKIEISEHYDGTVLYRLYITNPQLLDPVYFSKESGLPLESIHIPELVLTEGDESFKENNEYITIKI